MKPDAAALLRADVAALPAYVPGARPDPGADLVKLSSNETPFPPLAAVTAAIAAAATDGNRYPEMYADELCAAIAARWGVDADQVVAGCGSVAVLTHVLTATCGPGDEVVLPWRSFEAYPILVTLVGATAVRVPLAPGARHDIDAMIAAVTERTRVLFVCSPNNPTGPVVTHAELQRLLAAVPRSVVVVLDEAYLEFVCDPDAADGLALLAAHPNLVLLRTFSKAYGLAGLRVGYGIAEAGLAAGIRSASTPFGVSGMAQAAAIAALGAGDEVAARVDTIVAERTRMVEGLRAIGWDVPDAQGNFVWLGVGEHAATVNAAMEAAGVLVRPFMGDGVRISVAEPAGTDRVLAVAAELVAAGITLTA